MYLHAKATEEAVSVQDACSEFEALAEQLESADKDCHICIQIKKGRDAACSAISVPSGTIAQSVLLYQATLAAFLLLLF